MYASLWTINKSELRKLTKTPKSNAYAGDAYGIHKIVYSLFPGNRREFLFLDKGVKNQSKQILIVSQNQPEKPSVGCIETKIIPSELLNKEVYAFEIKLNPVLRVDSEERPIKTKPEIVEWFMRHQISWGFEADRSRFEIVEQGMQSFKRRGVKIVHNLAVCRGILRVVDRTKFIQSFQNGIGRGKAFGFGLLQIVPIK